jgi:predicted nucleic acid-binding Zn ribbon protein
MFAIKKQWLWLAFILVLLLIGSGFAAAQDTPEVVVLTFHRPLQDQELISLLDLYQTRPRVFYFVAGDLFGSHRVAPSTNTSSAVQHLRDTVVTMQERSSQNLRQRLNRLALTYSSQAFQADESAQQDVEYFLHRLGMAEEIKQAAVAGEAFIYAAEATVSRSMFTRLVADPLVSRAISSKLPRYNTSVQQIVGPPRSPEIPAHLQFHPSPSLDPVALYDKLQHFINTSEE